MKILFHVDKCKLIHRKRKANDRMIERLCHEYENIFEDGSGKISVGQGKIHEYPVMNLYYTDRGQVRITMFSYNEDILTAFKRPSKQSFCGKWLLQETVSVKSLGVPQSSYKYFVW